MKKVIALLRWLGNMAAIGCISLMLFSVAYASVRFLPALFDNPDYLDYNSDRKLSVIAKNLPGHEFDYNNEYNDLNIMQAGQTLSDITSRAMKGIEEVIKEAKSMSGNKCNDDMLVLLVKIFEKH